MQEIVFPSPVQGQLQAPASKSVAQRAIAAAALAKGQSRILYPGDCEDVQAAVEVCRKLGAEIRDIPQGLDILGGIRWPHSPLDCGEAGLGIRMFSAIAASFDWEVVLTGRGSLTQRPMGMIESSLQALGVECRTHGGYVPVRVKGPIAGGTARIDGSLSSQVLTGILMAAPLAQKSMSLLVADLKSKPYIDITLEVMKAFGVVVEQQEYQHFEIKAPQKYMPCDFTVEGDWSGAAFLLVAGAIAGDVVVKNLKEDSFQADKAILQALKACGARLALAPDHIRVQKNNLQAFEFDATHCPDLFPPLVALAAYCEGISRITGVERLANKESNRGLTLQQEFGKLGVAIQLRGDEMWITGGPVKGGHVHSHYDHRIAMACAIAALGAQQPVIIDEAKAVAKSYPGFFADLKRMAPDSVK